jgi:hypothetical protein
MRAQTMQILVLATTTTTLCLLGSRSEADYEYYHGDDCVYAAASEPAFIEPTDLQYTEKGLRSDESSALLYVLCPIDWRGLQNTNPLSIWVDLRDKNSNAGATGDFYCHEANTDSDGDTFYGPAIHSCDTGLGCTAAQGAHVSSTGLADYLVISAPMTGTYVNRTLLCQIPPKGNGGTGYSYLASYFAQY